MVRLVLAIALFVVMIATDAAAQSKNRRECEQIAQPDTSIRGCTAIIKAGRESQDSLASAYTNRGNAYDKKGQFDRAIADYEKAIQLNPKFAKAYNNRGVAYAKKGQYDRAIAEFDTAIKLNPKYAFAYHMRGLAYGLKGQHEIALGDYLKAYDLGYRSQQMMNGLMQLALLSFERYAALLMETGNAAAATEIDQQKEKLRQSWNTTESDQIGFDPSKTFREYSVLLKKHGREAEGKRMDALAEWYLQFNIEGFMKAVGRHRKKDQ